MKTPKVGFVSLGCPKALVDSERILTQLKTEGYQVASDYDGADLVVVNTCGFIESAVQESLDAIGEAIDARFDRLLPVPADPRSKLYEAMRYAVMGGGKRMRPLLVVAHRRLAWSS